MLFFVINVIINNGILLYENWLGDLTVKNKKDKSSYIFTRETLGMTILLFSAFVTVMLLSGSSVFAGIGKAVCTFMYGTFGYGSFLLVALCVYLGVWLVFEKKIKISAKTVAVVSVTVFVAFLLFHAVSTNGYQLNSFGEYLTSCYNNAELGFSGYTFGGIISAVLVYPVAKATTFIGAYIIFSILLALCLYLTFLAIKNTYYAPKTKNENEESKIQSNEHYSDANLLNVQNLDSLNSSNFSQPQNSNLKGGYYNAPVGYGSYGTINNLQTHVDNDKFSPKSLGKKIIFEKDEFAAESYRRNMIFNQNSYFNNPVHNEADYLKSFSDGKKKNEVPPPTQTYSQSYQNDLDYAQPQSAPSSYVYGEKPVEKLEDVAEHFNADTYVTPERDFRDCDYTEGSPYAEDYTESLSDLEQEENFDTQPNEVQSTDSPFYEERVAPTYDQSFDDSIGDIDFNSFTARQPSDENVQEDRNSLYNLFSSNNPSLGANRIEPDTSGLDRNRSNANLFDEDEGLNEENIISTERGALASPDRLSDLRGERRSPTGGIFGAVSETDSATLQPYASQPIKRDFERPVASQPTSEVKKEPEKKKHVWEKYVRPGIELLKDYPENTNVNHAEIEDSKQVIVDTLARVRIESEVSDVVIGPAITRYDVIIKDNVNIRNSMKYRETIAMSLKKNNVNCYLNFAKGVLSIEVPNSIQSTVGLKNMLVSKQYMNAKPNGLTFALGKNYDGEAVCPDITKMPHLLVAGTSGSGKSVCLRSIIVSLIYKYGPEDLRFILVDPKQSEFIMYDKLPHLMINEIISDVDKAVKALNWAVTEMERRYKVFKEMTESGVATADIFEYNSHVTDPADKLPKIVIILDEFGDLMLQAKKDIEMRIVRLAQKARACGIHLILATQRPSVDCITGLIKSNLATRIGFKVGSNTDSMTIFDCGGAEKLIGNGDMFFRSSKGPELIRIQGCFIDSGEAQSVANFVKEHNKPFFDESVSDYINRVEEPETDDAPSDGVLGNDETKIDDLFIKALHYCVVNNQASVSMIQRRFPCGYIKACKIVDWMTNMNYITPSEGSKPRKVLLSLDEFRNKYGDVED